MRLVCLLICSFFLISCAKKESFDLVCLGNLDQSISVDQAIQHEQTPELTYFYKFKDNKVYKNHYDYGFPCSENTPQAIRCVIDLTIGDGSVTTITLDKQKLTVTDHIQRKAAKTPGLPISEDYTSTCQNIPR